jgi:drug/metabolite transporter (DMT)-like permease
MGNYTRGVVAMIAASALFSVMSVLIRLASDIDPFKTTLFRFVIGMTVLITLALSGKLRLRFSNKRLLTLRGITGGIAVFLFYLSISKIGLAKGTVIVNTYPLFATLGGALLLKERVRPLAWLFILSCLIGMVLINYDPSARSFDVTPWDGLALVGSLLSAVAVIAVRKLSETDTPHAIFMSQCVFGIWIVIIPANIVPVEIGIVGGLLLLSIGLVATGGQILMTWAYGKIDVSTGSLLSLLMMVFNVILGTVLFHEVQNAFGILGMATIILSCAGIAYVNRR